MILAAARFGEDLDAAVAELVIFCGEGVLIDADLTDGFLGRDLAAAEAVNENGASVRTGGWAGEGLKVGLKVIGVVGKGVEIFAAQDQGAGVRRRINVDGLGRAVLDLHLFSDRNDEQMQVEALVGRAECELGGWPGGESGRGCLNRVVAECEAGECVGPRAVRLGRSDGAARLRKGDGCAGNKSTGLIGDGAFQRRGLSEGCRGSKEKCDKTNQLTSSSITWMDCGLGARFFAK